MTDMYEEFFVEDNDLIVSVLKENISPNNEGQTVPQSNNLDIRIGIPGNSINVKNVNSTIVDLCESPKKNPTVQSRLSHFFRKPISDEKMNCEHENQKDELRFEIDSSSGLHNNADNIISSSPAIFYKESDAEGFHLSSGSNYVYPSNFPVREYQMNIIETALFNNTLVSLPTGMGKTFIAAVVMYNFYRWYPMGKIVFMAPTRPLVTQQIEACHSIMGFPRDVTFEMTGNISPEQRYLAWKKYRVFFLTPQVMANDLHLNKCPSNMLKCVIVDEAHRATKDYAYVQVLNYLHEQNQMFRVVGLSATPGTTIETVSQVIQNLNISKLEFRTDESPDVVNYTNKKDVQCILVKLTNAILNIRTQFLAIYDNYSRRLKKYHILPGNITNLSKFQILNARQKFMNSNLSREMPKSLVGGLINDFTVCISLAYALELLTIYGIKVFYLQSLELTMNHKCLSNDATFQSILHDINKELNSQDLTWSHPKLFELKQIVQHYFNSEDVQSNSKIIIFCQYRLVVVEVFQLLKTFGSSVKPVMFVGQSLKEKGGLPQKKQLEVMNRFKRGDFNVLIATSVAEEGLDIGDVDLIICLEANKSPIKFIQRLGRTGRKRSGKCITLLTEGKEQMKYKSSVSSSKTLVHKMLKNNTVLSKLAPEGPRLIPKHIKPQRLMIHVKPTEKCFPNKKKEKCTLEDNNIPQYITSNNAEDDEEEILDIFQNNKNNPKRKSKKRKSGELKSNNNDIEVKSPMDWNFDNNSNGHNFNDFNAPACINSSPLASSECNSNDERGGSFIAEEKAFNEWIESCEPNAVVLNNKFFDLLNFFIDSPTAINIPNGEPLKCILNYKRNSEFIGKNDFKSQQIFEKLNENSEMKNLNYENGQPLKNLGNSLVNDNNEHSKGTIIICNKDSTGPIIIADNDDRGETDFEEFIRSPNDEHGISRSIVCNCEQNSKKMMDCCKCYDNKHCVEPLDFKNNALNTTVDPFDEENCDEDYDECAGNIDFQDMFKSQKADCYIEDYFMNKIDEGVQSNENAAEVDNDDVISISNSPEFFSGRLTKKTVQTKLENCLDTADVSTTPKIEFIDLCVPSPPRFATDKSSEDNRISNDVVTVVDENNYSVTCSGARSGNYDVPSPDDVNEDDDMDFLFVDYFGGNTDVFTQKETTAGNNAVFEVTTQKEIVDRSGVEVYPGIKTSVTVAGKPLSPCREPGDSNILSQAANKSHIKSDGVVVQANTTSVLQLSSNGSTPFNIMKACNLLKPGFSLKRSKVVTAGIKAEDMMTKATVFGSAVRQTAGHDDVSPIRPPELRRKPIIFSQSTPKVHINVSQANKHPQEPSTTEKILNLLTSSSDDDDDRLFVNDNKVTSGRPPAPKKRRRKPKKKLVFIDDEADVSNCGDPAATAAAAVDSSSTSSSHDDDEFDSSFIDDDQDKSGPSTSITKQYLQSVRSPPNARGVFKIPTLSKQHYNIDVYSQMVDDKMDSSYEEDSFCVRDESVLSEKRPAKRKRILKAWNSDSDSPDECNRNMLHKRPKVKTSLDSDYS